jgi:hypothetical protein
VTARPASRRRAHACQTGAGIDDLPGHFVVIERGECSLARNGALAVQGERQRRTRNKVERVGRSPDQGSRQTIRPFEVPSGRFANTRSSRPALSCSINSALTPICTSSFTPHGAWRSGRVPKAAGDLLDYAETHGARQPRGRQAMTGRFLKLQTGDARRRAASRHRRSARRCALSGGTRAVWSRAQAA